MANLLKLWFRRSATRVLLTPPITSVGSVKTGRSSRVCPSRWSVSGRQSARYHGNHELYFKRTVVRFLKRNELTITLEDSVREWTKLSLCFIQEVYLHPLQIRLSPTSARQTRQTSSVCLGPSSATVMTTAQTAQTRQTAQVRQDSYAMI